MSIFRLVYVACDECGDPAGTDESMADDAKAARRLAQLRSGFVRRYGRDLCPRCATLAAPERTKQ